MSTDIDKRSVVTDLLIRRVFYYLQRFDLIDVLGALESSESLFETSYHSRLTTIDTGGARSATDIQESLSIS